MNFKQTGLTDREVKILQEKYGKNELVSDKKENFIIKIFHIICEPMFLLLIAASVIYFILGEPRDGIIMLVFVVGIISIDIIQEWKTDKTLKSLKKLSSPKVTVIRNGIKTIINSEDLVSGDLMMIYEGVKIPADGFVVKCSGISVDESSLTGESTTVWKKEYTKNKQAYFRDDYCYAGTLVIQGTATVLVDKIGSQTEYGKIGLNVSSVKQEKTVLQKQTDKLVKTCAIIAFILFLFVSFFTFINLSEYTFKDRFIQSILSGITLAMAMIPEEFPVVLTVFLSMGAWRLAKKNSLVKRLPSVETLGSISVLCVDKTGTITKNEMTVNNIWTKEYSDKEVCKLMGMSCEEDTYDPMEKAMLKKCLEYEITKKDLFSGKKIKNYPFSNDTKMVGQIWSNNDKLLLVAKGSPESIISISKLTKKEKQSVIEEIEDMSKNGLRVIAIASKKIEQDEIKDNLGEYELELNGLIGLIDPPKDNIKNDIEKCNRAGVRVVMITGDNGLTASSIAKQIGFTNYENIITGEMLDLMTDEELKQNVKTASIFSRVVPQHKMKIVKAFKENGDIVAMTGDGVNDAPALKYADIGISMGKRGSEVSREASDLILMDDNFSTIVDTIKDGRRIYDNICKAVGYIVTIHIPIAISSLLGPILNIAPSDLLLLPLHVVLLELIIDPTCSIIFERQPTEKDIMDRNPRKRNASILNFNTLIKSLSQGIIMFLASFITYYVLLKTTNDSCLSRTMGLVIIMLANLFLVQVNSSDSQYAYRMIKHLIKDKVMWFINIGTILGIAVVAYSPLNKILKLQALNCKYLFLSIFLAFISVFWFEIIKIFKNKLS